jgi:hypothetical protein
LLLKSTKETPYNAQKYVAALQARDIPVYNPRNIAFLEQEEVLGLLGSLLAITDGQGRHVPQRPQELADLVANCRVEYIRLAAANPRLQQYVSEANANLERQPGAFLTANLQEVVYYLLSLPPFDGWSPVAENIDMATAVQKITLSASRDIPFNKLVLSQAMCGG